MIQVEIAETLSQWIGPIPEGHAVLRLCGTPLCCNPDHLYAGVFADIDTEEAKLLRARPPTLTPDDVRAIHTDKRKQVEIAKAYGLSENAISDLPRGKTHRHVV